MKRLKLENLNVESFATSGASFELGTVRAHQESLTDCTSCWGPTYDAACGGGTTNDPTCGLYPTCNPTCEHFNTCGPSEPNIRTCEPTCFYIRTCAGYPTCHCEPGV